MRKCEYCGTPVPDDENKCVACGAWYKEEPEPEEESEPTIAESVDNIGKSVKKKLTSDVVCAVIGLVIAIALAVTGVNRLLSGEIGAAVACGIFVIGFASYCVDALRRIVKSISERKDRD